MHRLFSGMLLLLCGKTWSQSPPPLATLYHEIVAGSRHQSDAFSGQFQPAALASVPHFTAGIFATRRFLLPDLFHNGIGAAVPFNRQALGVTVQHMGGQWHRQAQALVGFAQKLGSQAAVGVQFHYSTNQVAGYRRQSGLGYTLGAWVQLSPQVAALAAVSNPGPVRENGGKQQAARYEAGLGADVSENLFLSFSLLRVADASPSVRAGLQYRVLHRLYGRLGILTGTGQFVVGGGYQIGVLRLDVYSELHPQLGLSPGLQLIFQPAAQKKE